MTRRPKDEDIARYFDENIDCCAPRRDPTKRPGVKLARLLEDQLRAAGIQGRDVLELGCGRGELSAELVRAGASRVTGMDLSADNIEAARRMSAEDGLDDRLEFPGRHRRCGRPLSARRHRPPSGHLLLPRPRGVPS